MASLSAQQRGDLSAVFADDVRAAAQESERLIGQSLPQRRNRDHAFSNSARIERHPAAAEFRGNGAGRRVVHGNAIAPRIAWCNIRFPDLSAASVARAAIRRRRLLGHMDEIAELAGLREAMIAAVEHATPPELETACTAVHAAVDKLQDAGWPIERIIVQIKRVGFDSGLSRPALETDGLLALCVQRAIEHFYRSA